MTDSPPDLAGAYILVVDDDATNLNVLTNYLKDYGFRILVARDGEAAVSRAQLVHPDLILLDVMMPGINGFETCQRLKALATVRDIPVIFMTALDSTEDKVRGFEVGAVDYVTKPTRQAEVLARVTTHLQLRATTRQLQQANAALAAANAELAAANAELAEANATKDKFFSIIAHDLRAPFDALMNFPEVMLLRLEQLDPEKMRTMLERMYQAARNTYELLQNLLTWARLQRGLLTANPEILAVQPLVERAFGVLRETALKKQQRLHQSIAPDLQVYADRIMVDTVLRNLISNALKFTPTGGQISLTAEVLPTHLALSVSDNGVGMDAAAMDKVFRLEAKHSTRGTADERGTGLGLMLCREMVLKNGGDIHLTSVVGQGTTVIFTLPRRPV